jgi:hypothetical protein
MQYATGVPLIPAGAISTNAAELLSKTLKKILKHSFSSNKTVRL